LFKLLIKTVNYITSGHVTQGAELYKQIRGCGIYWALSDKVPTLYIKTSKGYTPEGAANEKKDIDSDHTIKRNLLLR